MAALPAAQPALAFDNSACWHYAEQQGPRPDVTCTPLSAALFAGLQNATPAQVQSAMNETGETYPDGTLRFTGNYLGTGPGYQGHVAFIFDSAGEVSSIDAQLDNPNQGGAYFAYHWGRSGPPVTNLPAP